MSSCLSKINSCSFLTQSKRHILHNLSVCSSDIAAELDILGYGANVSMLARNSSLLPNTHGPQGHLLNKSAVNVCLKFSLLVRRMAVFKALARDGFSPANETSLRLCFKAEHHIVF